MTVCLIANDEDSLFLMSAVLTRAGANVVTLREGTAGIDEVVKHGTDLVIVDVLLPDMDGLEVGRRLRAFSKHKMHLVALTAAGGPEIAYEVASAGFDELMRKPVGPGELTALIERLER